MIEESTNVEQVKDYQASYPENIKALLEKTSRVDIANDEEVRNVARYFRFQSDIDQQNFKGFKMCGHYPFESPPLLEMKDDFTFVLTPMLLSKVLWKICQERNAISMHAAQVGVNYDFFIIRNARDPDTRLDNEPEYETFINSRLNGLSDEGQKGSEINSSYPGLYLNIERPKSVDVIYYDVGGNKNTERLGDDWARYYVQNYSLSRGKPFWQFASKLKQEMALKKRNKKFAKGHEIKRLV